MLSSQAKDFKEEMTPCKIAIQGFTGRYWSGKRKVDRRVRLNPQKAAESYGVHQANMNTRYHGNVHHRQP